MTEQFRLAVHTNNLSEAARLLRENKYVHFRFTDHVSVAFERSFGIVISTDVWNMLVNINADYWWEHI
jgi:hypothetical protein